MPIDTIVLNLAYVSLISASLHRDLVRLRLLLVAAAVAFVIYGLLNDIGSMVAWNVVIGTMHTRRLIGSPDRGDEDGPSLADEVFAAVSGAEHDALTGPDAGRERTPSTVVGR